MQKKLTALQKKDEKKYGEYAHKQNIRMKRLKEFNRQMKFKPFVGLREILEKKKDLDSKEFQSVNSDLSEIESNSF